MHVACRPAAPPGQILVQDHSADIRLRGVCVTDPAPAHLRSRQNFLDDVLRKVAIAGEDDRVPQQARESGHRELLEGHIV
ncbi:hypothetical protein Asp14428_76640 [Actinoplanes sp. NBRC 14428]|nr:hypothetical protein Asp14428_76640 [Actinoplanes sp. NBRC 14428]